MQKIFYLDDAAIKYISLSLRAECHTNIEKATSIKVIKNDGTEFYDVYHKIKIEENNSETGSLRCSLDLPNSDWSKDGEYDIVLVMSKCTKEYARQLSVLVMYNYLIYMKAIDNVQLIRIEEHGSHDIELSNFESFIYDFCKEYVDVYRINSLEASYKL